MRQQTNRALLKLERRRTSRRGAFHCIDSTFVKNIYGRDCIGRNPTDRGRMATKVSALVDQDGLPLSLRFFPANGVLELEGGDEIEECCLAFDNAGGVSLGRGGRAIALSPKVGEALKQRRVRALVSGLPKALMAITCS